MQGGIPAVLIYEDLEFLTPYMHTADDVVGLSLNSPELLEANARLGAAAVATLAGPLTATSPQEFMRGDANVDGVADLSDAVAVLLYLFGGQDLSCEKAADADDSGELTIGDAIFLLGYLFAGAPMPPPPFHECLVDPTEDDLSCRLYTACSRRRP